MATLSHYGCSECSISIELKILSYRMAIRAKKMFFVKISATIATNCDNYHTRSPLPVADMFAELPHNIHSPLLSLTLRTKKKTATLRLPRATRTFAHGLWANAKLTRRDGRASLFVSFHVALSFNAACFCLNQHTAKKLHPAGQKD